MKAGGWGEWVACGGLALMTSMSAGCGHTGAGGGITAPGARYREALTETAPSNPPALPPGSDAEREAVGRVVAMFADFSLSNVTARVRDVYAEDAYLRDGFKELRGLAAIAPYMIRSTEPLRHCAFAFEPFITRDGDYYLRWVMTTNLRRDPPERVTQVIGMSHIRFNRAGRVIFHQDYWDPSDVLYSRIPIAGWLIHKVKAGL